MKDWLVIPKLGNNLKKVVHWSALKKTNKHWKSKILRCGLAATVNYIWWERNKRVFQDQEQAADCLFQQINAVVGVRVSHLVPLHYRHL